MNYSRNGLLTSLSGAKVKYNIASENLGKTFLLEFI